MFAALLQLYLIVNFENRRKPFDSFSWTQNW